MCSLWRHERRTGVMSSRDIDAHIVMLKGDVLPLICSPMTPLYVETSVFERRTDDMGHGQTDDTL